MDHPVDDYLVPIGTGVFESAVIFGQGVMTVLAVSLAIVLVPMILGIVLVLLAYGVIVGVEYGLLDSVPTAARYWVDEYSDED